VSLLQSNCFEFGSGIVVPSGGFVLQNRGSRFSIGVGADGGKHPDAYAPGKRPFHTLSPYFVRKNQRPYAALAVKGGTRQPYAFTQIFLNHVEFGWPMQVT